MPYFVSTLHGGQLEFYLLNNFLILVTIMFLDITDCLGYLHRARKV